MIRIAMVIITAVVTMAGCEGRRNLDNPENLDNMPVESERVEDTADLHGAPDRTAEATTSTDSAATTQTMN